MRIDGVIYEFTVASVDLERDGMSLECERMNAVGERTLALEAFWHDPTGRFSVWSCGEEAAVCARASVSQDSRRGVSADQGAGGGTKVLVYVTLVDEGTDVWQPVTAEVVGDGCYRIIGNQPEEERWQFAPGALVRCEERRFQDGTLGLVVSRKAD